MRHFHISYNAQDDQFRDTWGAFSYKLEDGEKFTSRVLNSIVDYLKQKYSYKTVVIVAFSEFEEE